MSVDPNVNTGVNMTETKPGYLTTEFWTTLLVLLSSFLNVVGVWNWATNWHGGLIAAIVVGAYNWSRGTAKQGIPFDMETFKAGRRQYK